MRCIHGPGSYTYAHRAPVRAPRVVCRVPVATPAEEDTERVGEVLLQVALPDLDLRVCRGTSGIDE